MRKGSFFFFLAVLATTSGQVAGQIIDPDVWPHPLHPYSPVFPIPSKEAFINQVLPLVVDSSFTCYYLEIDAGRCGFIKYDFDEWDKYGLQEDIPIVTLNELSEKCYRDSLPATWQQDSLVKADCIDWHKALLITRPFARLTGATPLGKLNRKTYRRLWKEWEKLPPEESIVFWFSKPEFTDDGQYAVMNVVHDCGNQCATGYTYLFRHETKGWKRIGRMLDWQS